MSMGLLVLAGAGVLTTPHLLNTISESAVVNASVVSIKAPFDGVLTDTSRVKGEAIPARSVVVGFEARFDDRAELDRLAARRSHLGEEQAALAEEIVQLRALDDNLASRSRAVLGVAGDVLRLDRAALERRIAGAEDQLAHLTAEADRLGKLGSSGAVASTRATEARAGARAQLALLEELRIEHARVERQIAAIAQGTLPAFGSEDGAYARQRRDEIAIRIADLQTRLRLAAAEAARVAAEEAALRRHLDARAVFAPRSDADALAWTASPITDTPVARGDEILQILDCSRRFLEVTVPERRFASIKVGSAAWVRLKGADEAFLAPIESVQGSGATTQTGRLAAEPPRVADGQITVTLRLPGADVSKPAVAARYCDVGRTAQVRFEREGVLTALAEAARRLASIGTAARGILESVFEGARDVTRAVDP